MSFEISKCKITVLKRTFHQDLVNDYLDDESRDIGPCDCFEEGEEFIIDPSLMPEDFCSRCAWAWANISKDILTVAAGANMPGLKHPGMLITGCTDWFRPVIFKVERVEME